MIMFSVQGLASMYRNRKIRVPGEKKKGKGSSVDCELARKWMHEGISNQRQGQERSRMGGGI